MALTTPQTRQVMRDFAAVAFDQAAPAGVTKADVMAAAQGLDAYLDANAGAINAAIPQPARGALSTAQKARLMALVTLARFGG